MTDHIYIYICRWFLYYYIFFESGLWSSAAACFEAMDYHFAISDHVLCHLDAFNKTEIARRFGFNVGNFETRSFQNLPPFCEVRSDKCLIDLWAMTLWQSNSATSIFRISLFFLGGGKCSALIVLINFGKNPIHAQILWHFYRIWYILSQENVAIQMDWGHLLDLVVGLGCAMAFTPPWWVGCLGTKPGTIRWRALVAEIGDVIRWCRNVGNLSSS